jgi:hypothetical protein
MAVDVVRTASVFKPGPPKVVLEGFLPPYDVSGGRFLRLRVANRADAQFDEIRVIPNWADQLHRLAPRQ